MPARRSPTAPSVSVRPEKSMVMCRWPRSCKVSIARRTRSALMWSTRPRARIVARSTSRRPVNNGGLANRVPPSHAVSQRLASGGTAIGTGRRETPPWSAVEPETATRSWPRRDRPMTHGRPARGREKPARTASVSREGDVLREVAEIDGRALADEARALAERLLAPDGFRRPHSQGVADRAVDAFPAVAAPERPVLLAAAWLHDIGYAAPLRRSTFHPLDGAWFLRDHGWPPSVVGLVAHHSGARFVAAVRGLSLEMEAFSDTRYTVGALADAVTFADQTTAPDGTPVDVETRLTDMLRRHGPDSPNARAHQLRAPTLRAAVRDTERRLHIARAATVGLPAVGADAATPTQTRPTSASRGSATCGPQLGSGGEARQPLGVEGEPDHPHRVVHLSVAGLRVPAGHVDDPADGAQDAAAGQRDPRGGPWSRGASAR